MSTSSTFAVAPRFAAAQALPTAHADETINAAGFLALAVVHMVLAHFVRGNDTLATVHASATFFLALFLSATRPIHIIPYACAYIAGAEVMWRMSGAEVFWESGKYAVALVLIIGILRTGAVGRPNASLLYFLLLVPSCFIPLLNPSVPWEWARQELSFNMSGPLVLMLAVWFFSSIQMSAIELIKTLLLLITPILGTCFVTVRGVLTAGNIEWSDKSMRIASSGYAPNQVSTVLGLGAFLCLLAAILLAGRYRKLQLTLFALALVCAAQASLTFSRGGLYAAGVGTLGAGFFFLRSPGARKQVLSAFVVIALISAFVAVPALNSFTGGKLGERFQETSTTGRTQLMNTEIQLWQMYPAFGVGPGKTGPVISGLLETRPAAHTEFTRMLGEHGIFGLVAFVVILYMAIRFTVRAPSTQARAMVVGLGLWTAATMMSSAMRLAAPGFILGLAAARFIMDDYAAPRGGAVPGRA